MNRKHYEKIVEDILRNDNGMHSSQWPFVSIDEYLIQTEYIKDLENIVDASYEWIMNILQYPSLAEEALKLKPEDLDVSNMCKLVMEFKK